MSITTHAGVLAVVIVAIGAPAPRAQQRAAEALAGAKKLRCTFPIMATGTWKSGAPESEVKPASLTIRFEEIDADEGTARIVGDYGPSDIIVRLSPGTLHFVQVFSAGPIYATTVFAKETRGGRLQAVHSRHEYTEVSLPGFTSRPEQYYGDCEVGP